MSWMKMIIKREKEQLEITALFFNFSQGNVTTLQKQMQKQPEILLLLTHHCLRRSYYYKSNKNLT